MKEALLLMARYNKTADEGMAKVIEGISEEEFTKDMGLYYKSVKGTLEHALATDLGMFGGMFKNFCSDPSAGDAPVFSLLGEKGLKPEVTESREALLNARKSADEAIIKMVGCMKDLEKIETLEFPGVKFEKPRYQIVMAILAHDAHHRGQIAAALDIMNVDNDFGGMLGV